MRGKSCGSQCRLEDVKSRQRSMEILSSRFLSLFLGLGALGGVAVHAPQATSSQFRQIRVKIELLGSANHLEAVTTRPWFSWYMTSNPSCSGSGGRIRAHANLPIMSTMEIFSAASSHRLLALPTTTNTLLAHPDLFLSIFTSTYFSYTRLRSPA